MLTEYVVSTPNVFNFWPEESIRKTFKAHNQKEAVDLFYLWLEDKYNYCPEIVSISKEKK